MKRWAILLYGTTVYLLFLVTFCVMNGFVTGLVVPKNINDGPPVPIEEALLVNGFFLGLFAVQHTIMARRPFKAWLTRFIPPAAERSTFVLATCLILAGMVYFWRPLPEVMWSLEGEAARIAVLALGFVGWGIVLYSTFLIDHFELFGLKQAIYGFRGQPLPEHPFVVRSLYRWVRNPLMLGFLIAFWAAPTMTLGRLFFCLLVTGYIFVGVRIEEHDLWKYLGEEYRKYWKRTPMLLPLGK